MKIAIVEDDLQMYERLQIYLSELLGSSAECIYFPSGEIFLKAWHKGAFNLIILDIFMDRLTGMDVAKEIRRTDQKVYLAHSSRSCVPCSYLTVQVLFYAISFMWIMLHITQPCIANMAEA